LYGDIGHVEKGDMDSDKITNNGKEIARPFSQQIIKIYLT
jgi:hypothetical protein